MKDDTRIINLSVMPVWKLVSIILFTITLGVGSIFLLDYLYPKKIQIQPVSELNLRLSPAIKNYIDDTVKKDKNITAIQVVTINFPRNVRVETYISIGNPILQELYNGFMNTKLIETPVFNDSKINNDRVLRLINGDFICIKYSESTAYKYAPQAGSLVSYVCGIAIPPRHFGEFSGILTIYLTNTPTKEEMDSLFIFSRDLSTSIGEYNNRNENRD